MRVLAVGLNERVYVTDERVEVDPEERRAEVTAALARVVTVWEPSVGEENEIVENEIELRPGDPGHAAEALRSLAWIDVVRDFEDATLPDEGEE